ncbi:MAG: hypothetical protein QMB24_02930 [Spirosomataceae bacterium]|jgi:hypothetical protein
MKKQLTLLTLLIAITLTASAQYDNNWALGLRVGEPLGINVRKYFAQGDRAFDVNIGTYGFLYGRERDYGRGQNEGVYFNSGLMVQGIYSWIWSPGAGDMFHFSYGFGGQINNRDHLLERFKGNKDDAVKKLSLGPTAVGGIEVDLPNNDLAVFLDGGAYVEALPSIFFFNWQVSGGVRLNIVDLNSRRLVPIRRAPRRDRERKERL